MGLSNAAKIFLIYLIAFEKMRKKGMFWKKKIVSFYGVIISLGTNIHNEGCRV